MKKKLMTVLALVLVIAMSVAGTYAYLTSADRVVNTFTVGDVQIKLDEAKANPDGSLAAGDERVDANSYKLLPGHNYNKDPMVTVLKGSESSYVKMTVTFSKAAELDAIFAPTGADMTSIFNGYNSANWKLQNVTKDTENDTRTYEFWYKETVAAPDADVALDALFDSITVPGTIDNAKLATIEGMTITVNAYAIQADGFDTPDAAWEAFDA